jgi:hypothetical protein
MSNKKITKKELSLIEGIVENSKEIIKIKNVIHLLEQAVFAASRCKYRLIEHASLKDAIKEYRMRIIEIQTHNATMMKVAYTSQYLVLLDKFHITRTELLKGYIKMSKRSYNKIIDVILFLSDIQPGFLEPIKEGDVREYTDELEKHYLSQCKSLWNEPSIDEIYLKKLKKTLK